MSGETQLSKQIRAALEAHPDVSVVIRVQSGKIRKPGRTIHLAKSGTADIVGQVRVRWGGIKFGGFFAIEVKRPGGRTDKARAAKQAEFREKVRAGGGFAAEVSSVDEAMAAIERARRGESE